jgi:hypothetical protein
VLYEVHLLKCNMSAVTAVFEPAVEQNALEWKEAFKSDEWLLTSEYGTLGKDSK